VPVSVRTVTMITLASPAKSCCLDPLPTPLLKNFLSVFAVPITRIANASLASGLVTDSLKHAVISPLIKKSSLDQQGFSNYRPVSGLPFLSKLIERLMLKQLTSHIEDFQLLLPIQSAYRVNYSTETALLAIQNDLLSAADAGMGSALLLLDLSAAFDTVDHQILLKRLASTLGVIGSALGWFQSFLSGHFYPFYIHNQSKLWVSHRRPLRFISVFRRDLCLGRLFFPSTPVLPQPSLRNMESVLSSFLTIPKSPFQHGSPQSVCGSRLTC
jgi:hypothetical protein